MKKWGKIFIWKNCVKKISRCENFIIFLKYILIFKTKKVEHLQLKRKELKSFHPFAAFHYFSLLLCVFKLFFFLHFLPRVHFLSHTSFLSCCDAKKCVFTLPTSLSHPTQLPTWLLCDVFMEKKAKKSLWSASKCDTCMASSLIAMHFHAFLPL